MRSTIRYKRLNGKKVALCDYHGTCKNKAYAEVYPELGKKTGAATGVIYAKSILFRKRKD